MEIRPTETKSELMGKLLSLRGARWMLEFYLDSSRSDILLAQMRRLGEAIADTEYEIAHANSRSIIHRKLVHQALEDIKAARSTADKVSLRLSSSIRAL